MELEQTHDMDYALLYSPPPLPPPIPSVYSPLALPSPIRSESSPPPHIKPRGVDSGLFL